IEGPVKEIFSSSGIVILPAKDAEEAEFIIRVSGNEFESAICATHSQSSLARKVYLRNPRAVLKSEVWRVDVPIRFSSPDSAKDAIMAEVTKQAEAFAEQWKLSQTGKVQSTENPDKTDSATSAAEKYNNNAQKEEPVKYLYVASKNSKVFHRADCRSAQNISDRNLIGFESREQAIGSGRRPCKICNP
ncbi:MAG: hypothetical protein JW837_12160, partial [Sedimentisphaerales bacterium]|nr:hypothetical protein [Sedimentisphaerales bacterium]